MWREADHPRDPANGEFIDKPGGWLQKLAQALPGSRRRDLRDELSAEDYDTIYVAGEAARDESGDPLLGEIYRRQGFDVSKPQVVSRRDLDAAIRDGWVELYRGIQDKVWWDADGTEHIVTQSDLAEQFRSGEHFPGGGVYGNGSYAGPKDTAAQYADYQRDGIIRMALSPDARVIELGEARDEWRRMTPEFDATYAAAQQAAGVGPDGWPWGYHNPKSSVLADMGRLAAAMGYDAMRVTRLTEYAPLGSRDMALTGPSEGDYYIIFNRGALKVQEAG